MSTIYYPEARVNIAFVPFDEVVSGDNLIRQTAVPPVNMRVVSNDIFTADTFMIELPEEVFPLDPRDVRCLAMDIHAADTGSLASKLTADSNSSRLLLGHTDTITQKYNNEDANTVVCEGRDYAGLLLDSTWQGRRLKLGRKLSELIEETISIEPALAPLRVVVAPGGTDVVIPKGKRKKGAYYQAQPTANLWEALTALAIRGGAIITVQLDKIVIQPPRNIINGEDAGKTPLFIDGQNIKTLELKGN